MRRTDMIARRPAARAVGLRRHRRRRHRRGHRARRRDPRIRRPAPGTARLRQRHLEPQHQTRAWRSPLPRTGQHRAGDGGAQGARSASTERSASGQQSLFDAMCGTPSCAPTRSSPANRSARGCVACLIGDSPTSVEPPRATWSGPSRTGTTRRVRSTKDGDCGCRPGAGHRVGGRSPGRR